MQSCFSALISHLICRCRLDRCQRILRLLVDCWRNQMLIISNLATSARCPIDVSRVLQGCCEVSDRIVQGLHLDQEPIEFVHGKTFHMRSQFDQRLLRTSWRQIESCPLWTRSSWNRSIPWPRCPLPSNTLPKHYFRIRDPTTIPVATMIKAKNTARCASAINPARMQIRQHVLETLDKMNYS